MISNEHFVWLKAIADTNAYQRTYQDIEFVLEKLPELLRELEAATDFCNRIQTSDVYQAGYEMGAKAMAKQFKEMLEGLTCEPSTN